MKRDELKSEMMFRIRALGLPEPTQEHRFHPVRRWRFDYAWIDKKVAVEIQGGVGRSFHFNQKTLHKDSEKFLEANMLGWIVIQVNYWMIERGLEMALIERALERKT